MPCSSFPKKAKLCRGDGRRVSKNMFYNVFSFKIYTIHLEGKNVWVTHTNHVSLVSLKFI